MISGTSSTPVDFIASVSAGFLEQHNLEKGHCTNLTAEAYEALANATHYEVNPGGSTANVSAALALLGENVRFTGPFGTDIIGALARKSLEDVGVDVAPYAQDFANQVVFAFLTPDGDRSFATYFPDNVDVPTSALDLDNAKFFLVGGYALLYPLFCASLLKKTAENHAPLIFLPNDLSVINDKGANAACKTLYSRARHVLMNEEEAAALLGTTNAFATVERMQQDGKYGGLTLGEQGAVVFTPYQSVRVPTMLDPKDFKDSNGAGDGFAAGYLRGVSQKWDLAETGKAASACAAVVLATDGARAPADLAARFAEKFAQPFPGLR